MNTITPPEGQLSIDQCWAMLDTETVGRVALVVDGHPEIFPVNFLLQRRSIVFRTAGGTKLWAAMTSKPLAFEIDGYDAGDEAAWSVVARGESEVIESQEEKDQVDALFLEPWQPGDKDNYVRLRPKAMTGRRFKVKKPDLWNTRLSDARRASFE
ncbi:pyridoxamine 5'-phosphate oxidase family protein [Arthrobacter oryzae]|jgi:nitroimidazol reductase NimA-like FMN-containing flavoprotein (pyridoxamine 5'-phosphate oxidase superfamily)|uniref:pyridoxamine 5'-phosphate oxidase family protein n=1 Tax=Arthrobacter oryzae TaxID=409290 RepID=UPI0028621DB4|nr:pyridoxamine 5'-phosphate oxidase family protein [Arthrobacter oryzae]MDR6505562.1 nitroimidazol reductase NimA-like FMN-containing flavoprotein (pyridoxamine 5'-phosphate oxidase superfamily) [Arthrobacter oryzae]